MSLQIKHVADLMGLNFRIPSYQRGYRWERKQIEQLLDDLAEFYQVAYDDEKSDTGYYCLQPIAVTKQDDCYDVIDGQQRLTTIYLILSYLASGGRELPYKRGAKIADSLYHLKYESREDKFFSEKQFASGSADAADNIDYYFMAKGYEVIKNWFENNSDSENDIQRLFLHEQYKTSSDRKAGNEKLKDVRVIWYEIPEAASIQMFHNLNYGKIALTEAELVKALLLECDRYDNEGRSIEKNNAVGRSLKWSAMEEALQNEFFWGMFAPGMGTRDLHLEQVLSFVAQDLYQRYMDTEGWTIGDSDWMFKVYCKAVSDSSLRDDKGESLESISQRVDYIWRCIQKVYTVFRNWFDDRKLYHWIGLYMTLSRDYLKKDCGEQLRELYYLYRTHLKADFERKLKAKIGEAVKITVKVKEENEDGGGRRFKGLEELKYDDDGNAIRKILLLFNVEMLLQNSKEDSRFPFHLMTDSQYKLDSIEHIHPQHLDDEDALNYKNAKQWFGEKAKILEEVHGRPGQHMPQASVDAIKRLNAGLESEKTFEEHRQDCLRDLAIVDKEFDELSGMKPAIMHSLCNLALVDAPTNSALGNKLLDAKRQVLINRTANKDEKTYVPLGTWYVFNKHFSSPPVTELRFWTGDDRDAYFKAIEAVYNDYTSAS